MIKNKIVDVANSSGVKFGILTTGSAIFIGMPCPCCGSNSCAVGLLSAAATGVIINVPGLLIRSFKQKMITKKME